MPHGFSWLQGHEYTLAFLAVFLEFSGIPIPGGMVLLSLSALAGRSDLAPTGLVAASVLAALIPDTIWFIIGRRQGRRPVAMGGGRGARRLFVHATIRAGAQRPSGRGAGASPEGLAINLRDMTPYDSLRRRTYSTLWGFASIGRRASSRKPSPGLSWFPTSLPKGWRKNIGLHFGLIPAGNSG